MSTSFYAHAERTVCKRSRGSAADGPPDLHIRAKVARSDWLLAGRGTSPRVEGTDRRLTRIVRPRLVVRSQVFEPSCSLPQDAARHSCSRFLMIRAWSNS